MVLMTMRITQIIPMALLVACAHGQDAAAPATPLESARAQTPSERVTGTTDQVAAGSPSVVPAGSTVTVGPRLVAALDKAIGERVSKEGDSFTASVVAPKEGKSVVPEGTKIVGRVVKVMPSMTGSAGLIRVVIDGIQRENDVQYIDARVVGVELSESPPAGRPVGSTGTNSAEVVGSIIPEKNLSQDVELKRDVLGRGAAISLGTGGDQLHQLDKGTRLAIEVRSGDLRERAQVAGPADITDLAQLSATSGDVIGREVELAGVPVESVIGDVVFWVGSSKAHRTLVVLDKVIDTPETRIEVRAGERVSLSAIVERMPSQDQAPRLWRLVTPAEAAEFQGHEYYLFARHAHVVR
jgi:hypothetical protein